MTEKSSAHIEMTIALPLDVVANKLMRIEEELRYLNMKVLNFGQERESGDLNDLIEARLERIHDTLDAIRARLSDLSADIQPTRYDISRPALKEPHLTGRDVSVDDSDYLSKPDVSEYTDRKPRPDRDD